MARRKSSIRTANESLQEQFLARVRRAVEDPTLLLPETVGPEPPALARLRRRLDRARGGRLPLLARLDRSLVGALWVAKQVAAQESAPRLLDARVDGNRRFYLQRGHVPRPVNVGVQNWDDPAALLLAYGPLATRHGLHLFAGRRLWSTGTRPAPPPEWFEDLAERVGVPLERHGDDWCCPHADSATVELAFRGEGAPAVRACGGCGAKAGNLHRALLERCLVGARPGRPVDIRVALPAGDRLEVPETVATAYAKGATDEAGLLDQVLKAWRAAAGRRYLLGRRDFGTDQEAFLEALGLEPWERDAARAMTRDGHLGDARGPADVLAAHRDRLAEGVDAILPGEGAAFAARHAGTEARAVLRLAREQAQRRERVRDLPEIPGLGPLGSWIDGFVRQARTLDRPQLLQRVRREVAQSPFPAHLCAFLQASGLAGEGERSFTPDQKEAGTHWAPLARRVLEATGPAYRDAVLAYLAETGAGESA
jgi:hypothetical protein